MPEQDSPLAIAASIMGILTFVGAAVAGFYAHTIRLKNAIDTQAEVSSALESIDFLETETAMLNNAYLASQIRQPERKYGSGDFKYFHGLYGQSLERMQRMDRGLRKHAVAITGDSYDKLARVKTAAAWMAARTRIHKDIEARRAESTRISQIQLAILSAKIDELSWHQDHHNVTCSVVSRELAVLQSVATPNHSRPCKTPRRPPTSASSPKRQSSELLKIRAPCDVTSPDYHTTLLALETKL